VNPWRILGYFLVLVVVVVFGTGARGSGRLGEPYYYNMMMMKDEESSCSSWAPIHETGSCSDTNPVPLSVIDFSSTQNMGSDWLRGACT